MLKRFAIAMVLVLFGAGCGAAPGPETNTRQLGGRPQRAEVRQRSEGKTKGTEDRKSFYFVQLTDTHWGARDGVTQTRQAVEMINALPMAIEFVVVTGDVFSDSIRREAVREEGLAAMKGLKVPVFYVPGNHDLMQTDMARTAGLFEKYFGPLNRKVEIQGVTCLFLNTEMMEGEKRSPGEVERDWVEQALGSGSAGKTALLFMHRPPVKDLMNGSDGAVSWDELYDTRWEDVFSRHPEIKAVFAGHFHRDVMCWIGAVPVYVSPAVARFWDRQPAFRLYQLKGGQVNYWTLYPERPKTPRP